MASMFWGVFVFLTVATIGSVVCYNWIPGGLGPEEKADQSTQDLIETVQSDVEAQVGQNFDTYRAVSYRYQVVAGFMYYVKVQIGANNYIHVKVWDKLDGTNQLMSIQTGKSRNDDIESFE